DGHVTGVQTCALPISSDSVDPCGIAARLGVVQVQIPYARVVEHALDGLLDRGAVHNICLEQHRRGIERAYGQKPQPQLLRNLVRSEERRVGRAWRAGW